MSSREDALIGALVGLARSADGESDPLPDVWALLTEGLAMVSMQPSDAVYDELICRIHEERDRMVPNCALCTAHCGRTDDYDTALLDQDDAEVRRCKTDILFDLHDMALRLRQGLFSEAKDEEVRRFMVKALNAFGAEWEAEALLPIKREASRLAAV